MQRRTGSIWSIGIYVGDSPFHFRPPLGIENPVLSYREVSDVPAYFVADPFLARTTDRWYMFFEVMNRRTWKGEIGLATSQDGLHWSYQHIVLAEPFHLSYPYVFEWENTYYMIPETLPTGTIQLYQATAFPTQWSCVGPLLDIQGADPSVFYFAEKWWMFVCTTPQQHDTLSLYFADDLRGPWVEHPKSPLVTNNLRMARPGGRVVVWNGQVIRYAQDCYPTYGAQVRAFQISELTPTHYTEQEHEGSPVLHPAGSGWNARGMHHIDPYLMSPKGQQDSQQDSQQDGQANWIACVDGCFLAGT